MRDEPTLGTLLRHVLELLDGSVERAYAAAGIDYRPRFTPIVRSLLSLDQGSVRAIARDAGITHSAASQTIAQMAKDGLVELSSGSDGRERIVRPTGRLMQMLPELLRCWAATNAAATKLEEGLSAPLTTILRETIVGLEAIPFDERIATERQLESAAC